MSTAEQQSLRNSLILKNAKCGLWDWDINHNKIYFCPDYFLIAGYEPDEFPHLYSEWKERVHPDDVSYVESEIRRYLTAEAEPFSVEFRFKTKADGWMWILGHGEVVERNESGRPVRFVGLHTDISHYKQPKKGQGQDNNLFEGIIAQAPIPMVVTDKKGGIEFFNDKFSNAFGYTTDDISTAEEWWAAAYPDEGYRQLVQITWGKAIAKAAEKNAQIETQEWDLTCKNGSVRRVEFEMMPLGEVSVIAMNDITERKKAEAILKESYANLDALVHTLAHDLRTPLVPILGYAELLQMNYKEQLGEKGLSFVNKIDEAATGMKDLMEGLLSLAESREIKRPVEPVSVKEAVEEVIKNLGSTIASVGVVLQINNLPAVHLPKVHLTQVFDNLIGNAVRYGGKRGDIIEVGGEKEGKKVRFFVRDHGPGLSAQENKHVFEVFYRGANRGNTKGSGIGLSIVQKIARNYGGHAWSEETPGGGCTFWVEIEGACTE